MQAYYLSKKQDVHNNSTVETEQLPTSWWTDKQNMRNVYGEMLFGHKKEWCAGTVTDCMNTENTMPAEKDQSEDYRLSDSIVWDAQARKIPWETYE